MRNARISLFVLMAALAVPWAASASSITISPATINLGDAGIAFYLSLPTGGLFTATTSGPVGNPVDTELYLFDALWRPLVFNDTTAATNPSSLLFDTTSFGQSLGLDPGFYHLLATNYNNTPLDQFGNVMFDYLGCASYLTTCGPAPGEAGQSWYGNIGGGNIQSSFDLNLQFTPSTVGGNDTMSATPEALPTPEPASLFLFGSGAMGLVARYRRRNNAD